MKEFVDFLGSQAPYDTLSSADLDALAREVEVEYFAQGAVVVAAGDPPLDHLWVLRTGAMDVLDRGRVVDQLGPGDTFGHISLLTGLSPALSVRAARDSLCLRLPDPRGLIADAGSLHFSHFGTMISRHRLTSSALAPDRSSQPVRTLMRPIVWSRADDTVAEVARRISEAAHSCALVRTEDGIGIVTDRDFREQVATGRIAPEAPVRALASFPVLTVGDDFSQAAAFARMVDRGVHHLVVLGSLRQPVGVLRVVDFASADVRSPLLIRSAIETAETMDDVVEAARLLPSTLVELVDNGTPALQVGTLHAAVVDALVRKVLHCELGEDADTPERSWLILGSMARREPLPGSDLDTALVWPDPPTGAADPGEGARADAERLLAALERCGLSRCGDGANATNPLFSRAASQWATAAGRWIARPDANSALLLSGMALDNRPLTTVGLGRELSQAMRLGYRHPAFVHAFLLESVAVKPPTGFVRGFVVDHSGRHRGQLNLKRGGLLPIAALGRWISVVTADNRGSTIDRVRRGPEAGVLTRDEADTLVGAFEDVYRLLLERDVEAIRSGMPFSRFIDPTTLDTLTRRHLRETFRAISSVQDSVHTSWRSRRADLA
jgi:CBS domain-containing protein